MVQPLNNIAMIQLEIGDLDALAGGLPLGYLTEDHYAYFLGRYTSAANPLTATLTRDDIWQCAADICLALAGFAGLPQTVRDRMLARAGELRARKTDTVGVVGFLSAKPRTPDTAAPTEPAPAPALPDHRLLDLFRAVDELPTVDSRIQPDVVVLTKRDGDHYPGIYFRYTLGGPWVGVDITITPGRKYAAIKSTMDFEDADFLAGTSVASSDTITPPVASADAYLAFASEFELSAILDDSGFDLLDTMTAGMVTINGDDYYEYVSNYETAAGAINGPHRLIEARAG